MVIYDLKKNVAIAYLQLGDRAHIESDANHHIPYINHKPRYLWVKRCALYQLSSKSYQNNIKHFGKKHYLLFSFHHVERARIY